MGAIEETGQTARELIASFRANPIMLGLMLINFAFLIYIAVEQTSSTSVRRELVGLYVKQQSEFAQLLAKCVDPEAIERLLRERDKEGQ